ncbi:uncharacterized protein LOC119836446 isoform X1 [Zerene cesonia]|uniref:uncharacterized protein LOC119836446 isoform X1 n=1 Tax=Zerene cesonia TaxID=33412 RepID=UPI0018E52449|nr:uncharacterized protein LOC119836446 isoform X1 [Zerene cesonia]
MDSKMFTRRSHNGNQRPSSISLMARSDYGNFFTKSGTEDEKCKETETTSPATQPDDDVVSRDSLYQEGKTANDCQNGNENQNQIEKQLNNALQKPVDMGPGHSMLQRMGWTGGGLGRTGDGIVEPIAPNASYVSGQTRNYGTGNLSGSAKRRFRQMVQANIPPEKAIHLCRKSLRELQEEIKKIDQENTGENSSRVPQYGLQNGPYNPNSWENWGLQEYGPHLSLQILQNIQNSYTNPLKPDTINIADRSISQRREEPVKRPIQVGIYNYRMMNEVQRNTLHRALNQAIVKLGAKGVGPRFLSLDHKPGWVQVVCEDELSRDWLFDEVPKLQPWPDAILHVRNEKVLEECVVVYIPQYEAQSIDEAIKLLAVQNEGLNTESWHVIKSRTIGNGLAVAFSIDARSLETLKKNNLKAVLGFKTIQFKVSDNVDPFSISLESCFDVDGAHESSGGHNVGASRSFEPEMQMYERRPALREQTEPHMPLEHDESRPFRGPVASLEHETRPYYQDSPLDRDRPEPYSTGFFQAPVYDETYSRDYFEPRHSLERYSRGYESSERYYPDAFHRDSYDSPDCDRNDIYSRRFHEIPVWDHIQPFTDSDITREGFRDRSLSPGNYYDNYDYNYGRRPFSHPNRSIFRKKQSFRGRSRSSRNHYEDAPRSGTLKRREQRKRTGLSGRGSFRNKK